MNFSLVAGPFVWIVPIVALGLVGLSLPPFTRRRLVVALGIAIATVVFTMLASAEATRLGWIVPALPWRSNLWIGSVFFALVWLPVGWRSGTRRSRVASSVAIPATLVLALVLINSFYYYFPTFKSLYGSPSVDQASAAEITRVRIAEHVRHPTPLATVPGSAMQRGVTLPVDIPPKMSGFQTTKAWVYLPPAWFGSLRRNLPVIELLGGTPSGPDEWLRGVGVDRFNDDFAARHHGLAPVVVMINDNGGLTEDSECVNRPGSMAETYALVDVRRFMASQFKVTADPRHWAIGGLSEGGMCALNIALRHPGAFTTIGNFSGEPRPALRSPGETLRVLFGGSRSRERAYDPNWYLRRYRYPHKHVMFVIGTQDQGRRDAIEQAVLARRAAMRIHFRLVKGGHTFRVWRTAYSEFLPFAWRTLSPPPLPDSTRAPGRPSGAPDPKDIPSPTR